jgi:hypothetical protein
MIFIALPPFEEVLRFVAGGAGKDTAWKSDQPPHSPMA